MPLGRSRSRSSAAWGEPSKRLAWCRQHSNCRIRPQGAEQGKGFSLRWGGDSSLLESRVQEGPEVSQRNRTGQGPAIDDEERGPSNAGLLAKADICPHLIVPPATLDARVEACHIENTGGNGLTFYDTIDSVARGNTLEDIGTN